MAYTKRYDWIQDLSGKYHFRFPYKDDTPCWNGGEAKIEKVSPWQLSSTKWFESQGIDVDKPIYSGEVGATNLMAEYRSNGWELFCDRYFSNDLDAVFEYVENELDRILK